MFVRLIFKTLVPIYPNTSSKNKKYFVRNLTLYICCYNRMQQNSILMLYNFGIICKWEYIAAPTFTSLKRWLKSCLLQKAFDLWFCLPITESLLGCHSSNVSRLLIYALCYELCALESASLENKHMNT